MSGQQCLAWHDEDFGCTHSVSNLSSKETHRCSNVGFKQLAIARALEAILTVLRGFLGQRIQWIFELIIGLGAHEEAPGIRAVPAPVP